MWNQIQDIQQLIKEQKVCKDNHVTSVLGIGGGSTIDASKAIAALTLADTDNIWDLVEKKGSVE